MPYFRRGDVPKEGGIAHREGSEAAFNEHVEYPRKAAERSS